MKHPKINTATKGLFIPDISFDESQRIYRQWANDNSYDELINDQTIYTAPPRLTAKMVELFPNRGNAVVLDIGAGTGIIAERLRDAGFVHIHGLEPLKEFVALAEKKKVYEKMFPCAIGGDSTVDAPDDTYDAVVAAGAYGPGAIPPDSFTEIVRIVKKGGYFVNCMRYSYVDTTEIYRDKLEPLAEFLEASGKWEKVMWEPYDNHFMDNQGLMMVYRILA